MKREISLCLVAAGVLSLGAWTSAEAAPRGVAQGFNGVERVVQSEHYGTPTLVSGEFRMRAPSDDAVAVAREFLRTERGLVGIGDPDNELEVMDIIGPDDLGMTHVKFAHRALGLPVFGSELIVHMEGNLVTSMNGVYLRSFRPGLDVAVGGEEASDIAVDLVWDLIERGRIDSLVASRELGLDLDSDPELGFFNRGLISGERTSTHLAWKVTVNGYIVFIGARDGQVLDSWDTIHTAMNREVYDVNNGTNLPGQLVCSESRGCNTNDADTRGAWNQFGEVYDYFKDTHNRDSWDGRGAKIIGSVHYSQNFINAYWNGQQLVFGDEMVALDVTAHEVGHGLCQTTANLTYKYQPGALNESLSDVWGVMTDREDWLVGEDLPIGAIRSMSNPNAYNQPKDMSEYRRYFFYDNGGVHINSGIPNYAAYLLSAGGKNMDVSVRGQGRAVVEQIWYRAEVTKLTSSAKFKDFANVAIQACRELFGSNSTECTETENAFKATGIL